MNRNLLVDAAIVAALVVLGVVGYAVAPLLAPKTDIALPLSACDLNLQPCLAILPMGGQLTFAIEPRPIPTLKPLTLRVSVDSPVVRGVSVDFAGSEMQMGYNRPQLSAQNDGKSFIGQANLPVCITGSMAWRATLLVDTGNAVVAVPFRFVTQH